MTHCNCTYRSLFWILAVLGFAIDVGTKYAIWYEHDPSERIEYMIVSDLFSVINQWPHLNRGALFGWGNNENGAISNRIFAVVSAIAVVVIIGWSMSSRTAKDGLLCAALGLVLGGAAGNLFDRIVFGGVRDFLWFRIEDSSAGTYLFNWPVFNVADACLVCGACLLVLHAFLSGHKQTTADQAVIPSSPPTDSPQNAR